MFAINGSELLRVALMGGFIGFLVFCVSYASLVWFKRNRGNFKKPLIYRLGLTLVIFGLFGLLGSWAVDGFSKREGIVDGSDLFVVHARGDAIAYEFVSERHVTSGATIAEFHHPATEGEIAVIDSRIKEAQDQVEVLKSQPPQLDPMLLQKQAQLSAQLAQYQQFEFDLRREKHNLDDQKRSLKTTLVKEKDQIDAELGVLREALKAHPVQMEIALKQLDRVNILKRQGHASSQVLDDRTVSLLVQEVERDKLNVMVESLTQRAFLLNTHHEDTRKATEVKISVVNSEAELIAHALNSLVSQYQAVEKMIIEDSKRAQEATAHKIKAATDQIESLVAERKKAMAVMRVKAPFDGHIVYQHSAPGLAQAGDPVLAISRGTGFVAKVLMPASEIKKVAVAGQVKFALSEPILRKYFSGSFREVNEAPFEKNLKLAYFDVTLPEEAIALLADARQSLPVQLMWQPPLLANVKFQASLVLFGTGCLLVATALLLHSRRRQPKKNTISAYAPIHDAPRDVNQKEKSVDDPMQSGRKSANILGKTG